MYIFNIYFQKAKEISLPYYFPIAGREGEQMDLYLSQRIF